MKRYEIIQALIDKYNYKSYLEVGTQNNATFNKIAIDKVSVDPDPSAGAMYQMTSDDYFRKHVKDRQFHISFVDGLHHAEQCYKDIINCLNHLEEGGIIVCHDMNPQNEIEQRVPRETKRWNGDVWRSFVRLRTERDDLEMFVIDTDEGCGIIRKGKQDKLVTYCDINYTNLEKHRKEWLNLISVEEFIERLELKKEQPIAANNGEYRIWQFQPYSISGNFGQECNKYCELVPSDNDWIIIADGDVMCLTPAHIHKIKEYIDAYPNTGMFVPYVNRVKQYRQVYDMNLFENPDVKVHRAVAEKLNEKKISVTDLDIVISGYMMIFKKSTWKSVGGFSDGILGVDNKFSKRILRNGMKIYLMNTIYCFHYYRFNTHINDKSHIK